jgi:hypothetical protein
MATNIPIYIPTFINSATFAPARVLPHLYFYNGNLDCANWYIEDENTAARQQSKFPYFDNYSVVSGSYPTSDSRTLLFNNETAVYGAIPTQTLYSTYWETYVKLLYNPHTRLLNCKAIIPLKDYFEMNLNDIVNFHGNYYHLRAINDYNLSTSECNLQLLGPIIADAFNQQPTGSTPPITGSTAYATASINLNEFNSGGVFVDANIIVSGSPYYYSGNFTQSISGGTTTNVVMEGKDNGSTVWGGYSTASATLSILDNGTPVTSSTQYIYSGSGDVVITFPTTFTAGHNFTISGSTMITGSKTPTPPATGSTLAWSYSVTGGPTINGFGLRVNSSLVESRTSTSSGNYTVNVGDVIYVVVQASGCTGGSSKANAYTSGIISDASCGTGTTTLTSYSYTVVSGDVGNVLHLDSFASCDGGCI